MTFSDTRWSSDALTLFGSHTVMFHMNTNRHIGVLFSFGGMALGHLSLVRGSLVITGPISILRGAVMLRGTLVMVRGLAVMFCWIV